MRFIQILVLIILSAAITIAINITGYGFTNPVMLSFDIQSNAAVDTRIYYKNDKLSDFVKEYSLSFTTENSSSYKKMEFPLTNLNDIDYLSITFDDSTAAKVCIKNLTTKGLGLSHVYDFNFFVLNELSLVSSSTDGKSACFEFYQRVGAAPYLSAHPTAISSKFLVKSTVDYYNPLQIIFFIATFLSLYLIYELVSRIFHKEKWHHTFVETLSAFVINVAWTAIVVFVLGEIVQAYGIHNKLLFCITGGIIVLAILYLFRSFVIRYSHFFISMMIFFLLMLVRYTVFKSEVGVIYHNEFMGYIHIVKQDLPFDAAAVLLLSLAYYLRGSLIKIAIIGTVFIGLIIMFVDYGINTDNDTNRLIFINLDFNKLNYREVFFQILSYFKTIPGQLTIAVFLAVILSCFRIFLSRDKKLGLVRLISYLVLEALAVWGYFANIGTSSVYDDKFYNVVEVNRGIEDLDFSKITASSNEITSVKRGVGTHKNVVLLVVNSLSSFSSRLYGGDDLMPNIDVIANANIWFKNFYDDESSNYSLITGYPYLHNGLELINPGLYSKALPWIMKNAGYATIMAYAYKPSDAQKVQYDSAGYDYFVDYQAYIYPETAPRYKNQSLDDKLFLEFAAKNIEYWQKTGGKNFFAQFITGSGIAPFQVPIEKRLDPSRNENDYQKVMNFTDEAVSAFVQELERINYFRDGILIIMGNHRAAVPVSKKEFDAYGKLAVSRVPLIIIDKGQKSHVYTDDISTASVGELIQYLTLDSYNSSSLHVNPFTERGDEIIIYQQLSPRSDILLKNSDSQGTFLIKGNKSEIVGNLQDKAEIFGNVLSMLRDTDVIVGPDNGSLNKNKKQFKQSSEWYKRYNGQPKRGSDNPEK